MSVVMYESVGWSVTNTDDGDRFVHMGETPERAAFDSYLFGEDTLFPYTVVKCRVTLKDDDGHVAVYEIDEWRDGFAVGRLVEGGVSSGQEGQGDPQAAATPEG